jgi:dTDP-4-dehydrorhamnose 3,5-epimerase
MNFEETAVFGVWLIQPRRHTDERGYFAHTWDPRALLAHGLDPVASYGAVSFNARRGTLRGLHWQQPPYAEAKLVRCTRGAIYDVALDLRPASPTYLKWAAVQLDAQSGHMLYLPAGCAHGFLTLVDETEVHYQISAPYDAEAAGGVRWDDAAFGITWPFRNTRSAVICRRSLREAKALAW